MAVVVRSYLVAASLSIQEPMAHSPITTSQRYVHWAPGGWRTMPPIGSPSRSCEALMCRGAGDIDGPC
jgi:hypothetical protein